LLIDGNPFMPIGLFVGNISKTDIKRWAGHFNCVMSYSCSNLKFKDSSKEGLEAVREVLDELSRNNIKIIFSIKDIYDGYPNADKKWMLYGAKSADESVKLIVNTFKDHPAVMAWYICDELGSNWIDELEKRKYLVNSLDMKHPTWAVYYKYQELPFFASTCDILGVDPYPIEKPGNHNMLLVKKNMDAANKSFRTNDGIALWSVPQFHNLGNYDWRAKENYEYKLKNFATPSKEEMQSMCLLMAIMGSKGFIGYSYFDIFPRKTEEEKRWLEICDIAELLKELAPFILSPQNSFEIIVENKQGNVLAKAFLDEDKRIKILIAGIGPGKSEAIMTIPQNINLTSRFGRTKSLTSNKYIFQGEGICSDILDK